ncbi:MAG TPA: TadE/TadG family type IV pilus assembly protein [Candidatus Limnocylindrales bacterium]|nr:TadE/TadG family type IV pilus assembly protein [Candidatus Limnocylindrales bacterium]
MVEFALVLPIMFTVFGACLDFARVYQAWIVLQGATRTGAEMAASSATSASNAQAIAEAQVCTEATGLPGYIAGPGPGQCLQPDANVTFFSRSTTAPGGSTRYPVATVTVTATFPFRTLFSYPLLTSGGTWTLSATESYSVVQGR